MNFISIDGDDIGQRIAAMHLANDEERLSAFVLSVQNKVTRISRVLADAGYAVIFCAADGVVARNEHDDKDSIAHIYTKIEAIGDESLTFSAGVGQSLREAYIALLAAKSNGKACLYNFSEMT